MRVLNFFHKASGLKVNVDKSEAMWIGKPNFLEKPYGLKWTNEPILTLGIWICNNIDKMNKLNQGEIIKRVEKNINTYKNVKMKLSSKIYIINTKIISQVNYIATSIFVDNETIIKIKKLVLDFLWDGKPPKIKYNTIIGDHHEGGIKFVDIESKIKALKISWIKKSGNKQTWRNFFNEVH